jgi:hypothetical protein
MCGIWQNCWREQMSVDLTRSDPVFIFLGLAFAFWMRRRPDMFARFFSLGWLRGFLVGGTIEHSQPDPPARWLISLFSWLGLVGIWGTLAELGIWLVLISKGYRVY